MASGWDETAAEKLAIVNQQKLLTGHFHVSFTKNLFWALPGDLSFLGKPLYNEIELIR
jgi:hypothetical protein